MVPDEVRIERLSNAEGLAQARITGTVENATLHHGQSVGQALAAIAVEIAPFPPGRQRLVLAHSAAMYVGGEYDYQHACVALLEQAGADLDLAVRAALYRQDQPPYRGVPSARRDRLQALREQQP